MEQNKDKMATTHTRVLVSTIETAKDLQKVLKESGHRITHQEIYDKAVSQYAKYRIRKLPQTNAQN